MAYLSPVGNESQIDSNGDPLSGGKIYSYLAGTTTPTATYTDSTGGVQQANPIILNTKGLPASPIWLAPGVAVKLVFKTSTDVTIRTVDNVLGVNDPANVTAQDEWVTYSGTPTYISATGFSVAGDQTGTFQVLRKLKTSNSGGTIYSAISAASYNSGTGLTTVTVVNVAGTLDAGLSAVSYGLLSVTNPSIPETTSGAVFRTSTWVPYYGQCRLAKSGANLALTRYNGNLLTINGANYAIPSAGVTLAPPATSGTLYYIYAFMSGATMTLEASTTAHSADTTTGVEIKTGDASRTLVGMARTVSSAWVDTSAQRFVSSWFNRKSIQGANPFTTSATATTGTFAELSSSFRLEFVCWSGDVVDVTFQGPATTGAASAGYCYSSLGFDGITAEDCVSTSSNNNAGGGSGPSVRMLKSGLSEGYHYATALGHNSGSGVTTTFIGGATAGARCVISGAIQG